MEVMIIKVPGEKKKKKVMIIKVESRSWKLF